VVNNPLVYTDAQGLDIVGCPFEDPNNFTICVSVVFNIGGGSSGSDYESFSDPFGGSGFISPTALCNEYGICNNNTTYIPQQSGDSGGNSAANTNRATLGCRVKQGVLGATNLVLAGAKTYTLAEADALLIAGAPATGGGSLAVAAVGTTYGVTSIGGQALAGAGQLYTAFGGDPKLGESLSQVGDILSGPVSGLSTLVITGNANQAQRNANAESIITGGAGLAAHKGFQEAVDFGLSLVGLSGAGCSP
jgi:hypothetical protein